MQLTENKIDVNGTAKRVRKFFTKDYEEYYEYIGHGRYDIKGIVNNNTKVSKSPTMNGLENVYVRMLKIEKWVNCVSSAINNCQNTSQRPYSTFLKLRYMDKLPLFQIENKIGYRSANTSVIARKACINFADTYLLEQLKQGIEVEDLLDLHIYK